VEAREARRIVGCPGILVWCAPSVVSTRIRRPGKMPVMAGAQGGANAAGTGRGLAASHRCEDIPHRAGACSDRVFRRRPHLAEACRRCSRAASGKRARDAACGTWPLPGAGVGAGGIAVAHDDRGIVHAGAGGRGEHHGAGDLRVWLRGALPGGAPEPRLPAGRGLAPLPAEVHDPGRPVGLSGDGRGKLQHVQSRPAARCRPGVPSRRAPAPASCGCLPRCALSGPPSGSGSACGDGACDSARAGAVTAGLVCGRGGVYGCPGPKSDSPSLPPSRKTNRSRSARNWARP
jgi:hypothetical protein